MAESEMAEPGFALRIISQKWLAYILRELAYNGPARFKELSAEITGISDRVLMSKLVDLIDAGLVVKNQGMMKDQHYPLYDLSEQAKKGNMIALFEAIDAWEKAYLKGQR
jgi:DNA-binding HxlR family transcriptional regulator